jgi:predicted RNA methylase
MTAVVILILLGGFLFYYWWLRHTWNVGAPYEGMPPDVVSRVLKIAEVGPKDVFYELGSGDGRVVIAAAMKGAKCIGIEIDKLRALYSKVWLKILRLHNAKIIIGDVFKTDISKATVVCTYLLPETHDKLRDKLIKELKKGTKVVAVGFKMEDWKPVKTEPRGPVYGPICLYKI